MTNPIADMLGNKKSDSSPLAEAKSYVSSHGGDSKTAFYQLCKEKGINMPEVNSPEEALRILSQQIDLQRR